jgi:chromosome partitioning protein
VLIDFDPQGSATRWLAKRPAASPHIYGIAAYERDNRTTRSFRLRVPSEATHVVVDTPAALEGHELVEYTKDAHKIIVPVTPSAIDVHACTRTISDLLLMARIRRSENRIGVVANRVRAHTNAYAALQRFLCTLNVPVVATIRDSQNYVRSGGLGIGIHEMKSYVVAQDTPAWEPLAQWLGDARVAPEQGAEATWASRSSGPTSS